MAFSKFKDKNKKNSAGSKSSHTPGAEGPIRVKLPREGEVLGVLDQRLGASRMMIKSLDGKSRNCRVPGRLKRKLWLREGDVVLVQPWEFDDEKADILFKYSPAAVSWLKRKGYLNEVEGEF